MQEIRSRNHPVLFGVCGPFILFIYLFISFYFIYVNLYLPLVQMIAKANKFQQNHTIKEL